MVPPASQGESRASEGAAVETSTAKPAAEVAVRARPASGVSAKTGRPFCQRRAALSKDSNRTSSSATPSAGGSVLLASPGGAVARRPAFACAACISPGPKLTFLQAFSFDLDGAGDATR
eukprot:CAMPEP_0171101600 /NCGR_PEP_ID=MMETSP0766_2-20121228/55499_1 /TAXON_ID=439317 /ORGANISM="Gambierdiscus australes, Strain CAWD 149" /LENGTH=118 /DNA_ID=CAMNT_0011561689 /DNA_START=105 /DNA_END=456 /DNA_ORIENTATION=-